MKYEELSKKIKAHTIPKVFFFYGEEKFLLENMLNTLKGQLVQPELEAFNYLRLEDDVSAEEVTEACEQFPQAAERRLVVVRNSGLFANAASKQFKAVKALVGDLPDFICLVFWEDEFDKKREKNLAFIEEAGGGIVNFEFLKANKLEVWAEKQLEKSGKRINASDLSYMIRMTGCSMAVIAKNCRKLIAFLGDDRHRILREDIDAVVDVPVDVKIYEIFRKDILSGNIEHAKIQIKLLREQDKRLAVRIMNIILDQLYEILLCKLLRHDGIQAREIMDYYDRRPQMFAVNNAIESGRRFSDKYLKTMLDRGLKYSVDMLTGRIDQWTAVDLYVSELARR